jgi:type II secretory pathway component PulC
MEKAAQYRLTRMDFVLKIMNKLGRYLFIGAVGFSLLTASLLVFGYEFEDPFVPMLPKPKIEGVIQEVDPVVVSLPQEIIQAPDVNIQGILLGTERPMVIINRGIYKNGDFIKGTDAKIHKIDKDGVTIIVKTQMFTLKTKRNILGKEAQ